MDRRQVSRLTPVLCACVALTLAGCAARDGETPSRPGAAASVTASSHTGPLAAPSPTRSAVRQVFIVPDLIGEPLDEAQGALQSLGSQSLDPQDASGLGRSVSIDGVWRVCTQSPKAGEVVDVRTVVILAAVLSGERCP